MTTLNMIRRMKERASKDYKLWDHALTYSEKELERLSDKWSRQDLDW